MVFGVKRVASVLIILIALMATMAVSEHPARAGDSITLSGKILGWDAVNLTWSAVEGAKEYEIYRSTSPEDLLSPENLIARVNWSNYPEYHPGWTYLPNETVEYKGKAWRATNITSSEPGGDGWELVGGVSPVTFYADGTLEGNTTYYYAVLPVLRDGKKGSPSSTLIVHTPPQPYRVIVYYISWGVYARKFYVKDIPWEMVTHVNYAFLKPLENGTVTWADPAADPSNLAAFKEFKARYPAVKVLVSVGGWTLSKYFSDIAADPEKKEEFARSVTAIVRKYSLDGVDIDWEYPGGGGMEGNHVRADDGENFVLLLKTLRETLDEAGRDDHKHYLLTAAVSPDPGIAGRVDWSEAMKYIDFINVMTYDFAGPWSEVTGHNAPLYHNPNSLLPGSVNQSISWYLEHIDDPTKITLGVPFYARSFANVPPENHGLFQPYNGTPDGTWGPAGETHGAMDYWDVAQRIEKGIYEEYWDEYSKVPWAYSDAKRIFITFDSPRSISLKTKYMLNHTLGGVMVWEITADRRPGTNEHPLLKAILWGLGEKEPVWIPDKYVLGSNRPEKIEIAEPTTTTPPKPPEGGICGPGIIVLLGVSALAFRKR